MLYTIVTRVHRLPKHHLNSEPQPMQTGTVPRKWSDTLALLGGRTRRRDSPTRGRQNTGVTLQRTLRSNVCKT